MPNLSELVSPKRIAKGMYWEKAISAVEGCTPVSPGCKNCWSADASSMRQFQKGKMGDRYKGLLNSEGAFNGKLRIFEKAFYNIHKIKKPTLFSVWNDLFHEDVPYSIIWGAFDHIAAAYLHKFIILTKRPERIAKYLSFHKWMSGESWMESPINNIIFGTSIESSSKIDRLKYLGDFTADFKLLSVEPCLDMLHGLSNIDLKKYIQWLVIGAETGKQRRNCDISWIRNIVSIAIEQNIPVFVKTVIINQKVVKNIDKFPIDLQYRNFPDFHYHWEK